MTRYDLTYGVQEGALRVVAYGHEGIGKSTLAAQMPGAIFIDVEMGTNQLPVARLPRPTSWTMLLDEVRAVRDGQVEGCRTLVIDTADAAEALCVRHLCDKNGWDGLESVGYGKGYTYLEEEFGRLLDLLSEVVEKGRNSMLLCHSVMRKFERPDESGAYDRFELKLTRKVAPKVKEWCDMLLFLDYKVFVTIDKNKKAKASGGERVIRTSHATTWDAKNRFGLPDIMPLDEDAALRLSELMGGDSDGDPQDAETDMTGRTPAETMPTPPSVDGPIGPVGPVSPAGPGDAYPPRLRRLSDLMSANGVTDEELRQAVAHKGYFPLDCKVEDYPQEFADWVVGVWDSFMGEVRDLRTVPFDVVK